MKTTSLRARSLACALLATTAYCGLTAQPAAAQTAPPAYRNFDSNGVDLVQGDYLLSFVEGSIGSGEAELALVRTAGSAAGGPSQWDGIGFRLTRAFAGGPATVTVTRANRSERFTESGGAFSSPLAMGSALAGSGGSFSYAMRDGTRIAFSDPSGNPQGGTTNFCKTNLQTDCSLLPTEISTPDGRTVTLDWTLNERCAGTFNPDGSLDCEYDWRLAGIANDFGHSIAFAYASGPPGGQPPASWYQRTGASFNSGAAAVGYQYPSNGVTEVTDMGGRVWRVSGGAIRRPGAGADTIVVTTNGSGTVISVAREGVTTSYARSVSGNVATMTVTQVDPSGPDPVTTIVSDLALSRPTSVTDPLSHTTAYQYDGAGRLTRVTADEGNYVQYSLDSRGNVTQVEHVPKSGSGATIVTSAVYPSSCSFNLACNQPTSTTDERGQVKDYDWDTTYGVLNSVTLPAPGAVRPQTRFAYTLDTASGRYQLTGVSQCATGAAPACVGTADEVKSIIAYNADGTIASTSSGDGSGALTATSAMTYTALGDLASVDGPLSGTADTVHYRYNAAREPIGIVSPDPDGAGPLKPRAVRNSYANGLLTKVERGNVDSPSDTHWAAFAPAQAVETGYDADARPVTSRLVSGSTVHALTQSSYDSLGRLQCVAQRMNPAEFASLPADACTLDTQGSGSNDFGPDRIVKTFYDAAGRVERVVAALGTADAADEVTTTYTDNGLVATVTDAEGNRTTFEYDGLDRPAKTRFPDPAKGSGTSSTTDYEQPTYESLAGGARTSSLVTAFRNRAGETIGFGHDALGRPTSKDLPGAEPDASYSYDLLGRMLSATQNGISVGFTWDALGRQRTQTIPIASVANPVFTSDYDLAGGRTRLTWPVDASGPTAYHVDYDYLVTGEMEKAREKGATSGSGVLATFGYDDLGRRSSIVRGNGASTSYQYDAVSRLWRIGHDFAGTSHDLTIEFAYNPASQIVGRSATNSAYAWDGHGSGSTASTADGLNRLSSHGGATPTYDAKGNITFDGTYSYAYSSENLLTSFSTSGALEYDPLMRFYKNYTTHFIHDGPTGELIGDYYNGNIVGRYVPGPGPDEPLALVDKFGARTWFHADERGSVIASSGAAGANSRIVKFDEYGKRGSGGSWRFAFTGQVHLLGDVYDYKNRHYNARLGRFLQADPIGYAGGMNLYAYVGGDPVNFVDPLGLKGCPAGTHWVDNPTGSRIPRCVADESGGTSSGLSSNRAALVTGGGSSFLGAGGGPVCVRNCGTAEHIPDPNGGLGTFIIRAPVYEWVSTGIPFIVQDGRYVPNPIYEKSPYSDAFDTATGVLVAGPMAVIAAVEAAPVVIAAGRFAIRGREISIGKNWRIAPFGNRTGHPTGRWPHYHRRGIGPNGATRPGQSIRRHRPWDQKPTDSSWLDRF